MKIHQAAMAAILLLLALNMYAMATMCLGAETDGLAGLVWSMAGHPADSRVFWARMTARITVVSMVIAVPLGVTFLVTKPSGTKVCPDCAERVKVAAKVCKHCGADLSL